MNPSVIDKLLQSIDIENNLLPYLRYSGWIEYHEPSDNWIVFHGEQDINGQPFELVLPRVNKSHEEKQSYIIKAVEILTALKNEPMQLIAQSIICYDRDIFYVRNTEAEDTNALPFKLAVNQIKNLKRTLEYSASSEKDARPYYYNLSQVARKEIDNFLFGHTFAGSFGFTVETPRLSNSPQFIQQRLFDDDQYPLQANIPIERRIMERIARGLKNTKFAEESRDQSILVEEYASGFNSNMCSSIVGMSESKRSNVEFRIAWSPKLKPGDDIVDIKPVRIHENGYEILDYVAKELKTLKPKYLSLTGHIRALTSSDNPQNLGTRRAVVLRALLPNARRTTDIILELERDDYSLAIKAHEDWQNIEVSGILSRSGTGWRLLNIRNFKVLA
jgi:hypothetical protein